MGLFDFITGAGKEEAPKPDPKASAEVVEKAMNDTLVNFLNKYNLEVENPKVALSNSRITVWGKAANQATKEKVVLALGNMKGVSQVDDQMTVDNPEPEAQFHTVVSGDTLGKIAKKFYGDAMKYPQIFEANKPMLVDPNLIYPGQVLRIPPLA